MNDQGLIDEHAPRNASDPNAGQEEYQPSSEEKKTIKMVECLFEKAKKHRAQYDRDWLEDYLMFRGKQWKEQRPTYRHSEVINFVFRTIQSLVPVQVDSRPRFEFLPEEPSDYPLSQILNEAAESDWQRNNWQMQLLEVVYDANIINAGFSCVDCDPETRKIRYRSEDPFYCFPDPDSKDVNNENDDEYGGTHFIVAKPVDLAKLKKRYPDKAKYLKADLVDLMKGSKTDVIALKRRSPVDGRVYIETGEKLDLEKDKALLVTAWLSPEFCEEDYEEKEVMLQDPESGAPQTGYEQLNKYPKGRKVVVCNGVLLEDGDNPYDDAKIPYQRYVNYALPREFWGISEVEQIKGPQRMFNKAFCFALDVLTLMGNPIWLVPSSSGVDPENLVNRPGLVVEFDGDKPPTREEGVQLQPYVLQIADKLAEFIDGIAGSQDVSRGAQPAGVTAASAITALQEASNTRVRLKSKILDGYLGQVGQAWVSRFFQFKTAPEVFRLTSDQGVSKYFRMHVESYEKPIDPENPASETVTARRVTHQPYLSDAEGKPTGQVDPEQLSQYETEAEFDCRVSTGSSLPFNKAEKEQKLLDYYDRKIIDAEEVLKGSEYPNYQQVLMRMQQKAQQDAQMAAQQQAQKSAPPPAA